MHRGILQLGPLLAALAFMCSSKYSSLPSFGRACCGCNILGFSQGLVMACCQMYYFASEWAGRKLCA